MTNAGRPNLGRQGTGTWKVLYSGRNSSKQEKNRCDGAHFFMLDDGQGGQAD